MCCREACINLRNYKTDVLKKQKAREEFEYNNERKSAWDRERVSFFF